MSTTVTYKGSTLTTVNNQTRTLKTAGKYMEGDVQLTDTTSTIVVSETYDTNGGIIKTITTTGEVNLQAKTITPTTSIQTVNPDTGYDGFSQVIVNAGGGGSTINNQDKTVNPSTSQQTINADSGYTGLGTVTVNAMPSGTAGTPSATRGTVSNNSITITPSVTNTTGYITGGTKNGTAVTVSASELVSGTLSVTSNGTKDVTNYASVDVNISSEAPTIESLSVTPSESEQTFNASTVDGYKPVTVSAISSTYVGSGITQRSSTDLTVSGATVTAPAGYYSAAAQKSVASGSASAPSSISGTSASVTTGTNTLTLTKTVSVTPVVSAGYVSSGTATNSSVSLTASIPVNPTVTASGATVTIPTGYYTTQTTKSVASGSATVPSTISGTAATKSTGTNTLTLTKTISVTPTVNAGYISSGTATDVSVSLTANVTTMDAQTITPGTSTVSLQAGTYLTGLVSISGDADLVASNIVNGVQIFGVTGNVVLQNYYMGSSAPTSSLGSNGDIYLQT